MLVKMDKGFQKRLSARFEKFDVEVGILNDGPHAEAKSGPAAVTSYAGGPARKKAATEGAQSISDISKSIREHLGFNYLTKPFERMSPAVQAFIDAFMKIATTQTSTKRAENALQAVVRNPILAQEYGHNSKVTAKEKGFDRHLIDTAQFFKAITARIRRRGA